MAFRLVVSERAQREIAEAYEWYETQLAGLGTQFLQNVDVQFATIAGSPQIYATVHRNIRRALLLRFPYGIFYVVSGDIVAILAVVHTARNPRRWPRRTQGR